tara:strand:- start:493 stop:1827 length:1335 start_codon:yes stop_codon:yes gene_type:complete
MRSAAAEEAALVSPLGALPFARAPLPRFRPGASRLSDLYDLHTFVGRLQYNWALCSPMGLRWGATAVSDSKALLADPCSAGTDAELWRATAVLAACAPNGTLLPPPFRTCGWALCNTPTIAFMVVSAVRHPTCIKRIFLGQWLNQTHLAGATWFNRGAGSAGSSGADEAESSRKAIGTGGNTGGTTGGTIGGTTGGTTGGSNVGGPSEVVVALSYISALLTAVPVAISAGFASQRWAVLKPFARFAPYPGVALANCLGCACMRASDVTHGIPVCLEPLPPSPTPANPTPLAAARRPPAYTPLPPPPSPHAKDSQHAAADAAACSPLGRSAVAGWHAVRDTCVTRLVMPVGNFLIVPIAVWALSAIPRKGWGGGGGALGRRVPGVGIQVGLTAVIFTLWLPTAAAIYPPVGTVPIEELEPPIRAELVKRSGGGQIARRVLYERGV